MLNTGSEFMSDLGTLAIHPPPDVIFLGFNTPFKNGLECLKEKRKYPKLKEILVVIFSTTGRSDIVEKTYRQGANYYICKPRSFSLLVKTIETALGLVKLQKPQSSKENFLLVTS